MILSGIYREFLLHFWSAYLKKVWWTWKRYKIGKLTKAGYYSICEEAIGAQGKMGRLHSKTINLIEKLNI